jgi:hypothetical protein
MEKISLSEALSEQERAGKRYRKAAEDLAECQIVLAAWDAALIHLTGDHSGFGNMCVFASHPRALRDASYLNGFASDDLAHRVASIKRILEQVR